MTFEITSAGKFLISAALPVTCGHRGGIDLCIVPCCVDIRADTHGIKFVCSRREHITASGKFRLVSCTASDAVNEQPCCIILISPWRNLLFRRGNGILGRSKMKSEERYEIQGGDF